MTSRFSFPTGVRIDALSLRSSMFAQFLKSLCVRWVGAATSATLFAATALAAQAPPILNSPYVCPNGLTYTVTTCKPYRTDQWCETVEKQNGNLVTTMDSAWSSMTGRLQGCTNAGSTTNSTANTPGIAPSTSAPAPASGTAQQTFNPPYLKEFPTVDQVLARLKGTDSKDTANRQMGAFEQFKQILQNLAGSRGLRGQLTPDEAQILGNYALAYDNLAKPLNYPDDGYFANPDFVATLFNTFSMPTVKQQWLAQNAQLAARVKASQQRQQVNPTPSSDSSNRARPLPPTNDPAQIAIRRCFELGGSALQCVSSGMSEGMKQFMGFDLSALGGSAKPGLVILGTYTASSGLFFAFDHKSVNIGTCGQMVQGFHNYSVSVSGGKYVINIANQPQALVLTLGLDGKASGPVAQDITGQKITAYEVRKNINTGVIVSKTPIYGPITVHCNVGTLTPGDAVAVDPGLPSSTPGVVSAIGTVLDSLSGNGLPKQLMLPPGPRMAGAFTSPGGMKIQFNDGSAIVDCAQAHILTQYSVSGLGGAGSVAVTNGSNPINLKVQPDGTLSGSGTTTVNGQLMTALSGADPVFASTSASCPLNMLTAAK